MSDWNEFEVDAEFGNAELIDWISLSNKTITYYIAAAEHDVEYATQAAAQIAYDEWKAAHPPQIPFLVSGDLVRINKATKANSINVEEPVIFRQSPTLIANYWIFEDASGLFAVDEPVTVVKV